MAPRVVPVVVQGGGSSAAGILLLLVAIVGLVALFSGNLERWIAAIAGPAGGPEGLFRGPAPKIAPGTYGEPTPSSSGGSERAL